MSSISRTRRGNLVINDEIKEHQSAPKPEEKPEEYYMLLRDSFKLFIPKVEFDRFFVFADEEKTTVRIDLTTKDHGCTATARTSNYGKHGCNCCRMDSFICNYDLNHVKSNFRVGWMKPMTILNIYYWDKNGSDFY